MDTENDSQLKRNQEVKNGRDCHPKIGEGNCNPLQCSCLETPRDGEAWWAAVYGVAQSQTWLKRLSSSSNRVILGEGNGNPLQYSCLENPMDYSLPGFSVHGVARVGHDLATKPPPQHHQSNPSCLVKEFAFLYSFCSPLWWFWCSKSHCLSWNTCGPWDCYSLWSQLNKVPSTKAVFGDVAGHALLFPVRTKKN